MPSGTPTRPARSPGATRGRRAVMPLLSGNTLALEDLRDRPVLRVEEVRLDLRPPAEIGDGRELLRLREVELRRDLLVDRAVAVVAEDLLAVGREDVVEVGLRL